ncbi:hypothetical protein P152DRAFT_376920, partial [Eremomyces bilateralis CBS 781.70]
MSSSDNDCDDCTPEYLRAPTLLRSSTLISFAPFILTFLLVFLVALSKLFPRLSGSATSSTPSSRRSHEQGPLHTRDGPAGRTGWTFQVPRLSKDRIAAVTFSASFALSMVLIELILCEISGALDPRARAISLRISIPALLFLLLVAAPALEIHSVLSAAGWGINGTSSGDSSRTAWIFECLGLAMWLFGFWYFGTAMLNMYRSGNGTHSDKNNGFIAALLSRIGIFGISMMACLAGFAAISALWQTFGVKPASVSESDVSRKQAGLNATSELLAAKESRLRALTRKISESPSEGIFSRLVGAIRASPDTQELRLLRLEISGLEATRYSLSDQLLALQTRRTVQLRAHTPLGRLLHAFSFLFALYCAYRILTTSLSSLHRAVSPSSAAATSATDPVTQILTLLAKLWDPSLDRATWSRQLSFLLSGGMLFASFNSALQTFLLLARAFPSLVRLIRVNFALLLGQICGTYVISSALLLRGHLPKEVGGVVAEILGAPLEPKMGEAWFDGWFLVACGVTGLGIWVGRRVVG